MRAWCNDIDTVALGLHPIRHLQNRHRGVTGQQIDHHALVIWIEMLDQHEGHAAVGRKRLEETFEGVETPCRSPKRNNWEIHTSALRQDTPVRLRSRRARRWGPASCH